MSILPFESESNTYEKKVITYQDEGMNFLEAVPSSSYKKINITNIKVNLTYNDNIEVYITISEPHFKGNNWQEKLIFETPVHLKNTFNIIDPFTISTVFNENEIKYLRKYLSKHESVHIRYPEPLVGSDYYFRSDMNKYDLLNAIKAAKAAKAEADSKPVNKLKDFFGIDR